MSNLSFWITIYQKTLTMLFSRVHYTTMGSLMLSSSSSSSQLMLLHSHLRLTPLFSFSLLKHSISFIPHQTTSFIASTNNLLHTQTSIFHTSRSFSNFRIGGSNSQDLLELQNDAVEDDHHSEDQNDDVVVDVPSQSSENEAIKTAMGKLRVKNDSGSLELPNLTPKEKKELGSYAHSLGKKLKSQQVGKSGVTDAVAIALVETLESNELLKLKIHNSCPGELEDVVKHLEKSTGSVVVAKIGRTVILYRPSLTKMKAEEKKKENQAKILYMRKQYAMRQSFQGRGGAPRLSGRGRRGSSRNSSSETSGDYSQEPKRTQNFQSFSRTRKD